MTRLFTDGAEMGDALAWSTAGMSASTTKKRTGAYSYVTNGSGSTINLSSSAGEIYARFGLLFASFNNGTVFQWRNSTTVLGSIYYYPADNKLSISVTNGETIVAKTTKTFSQDVWYLIEIHIKIADSGGTVELKIDGELDATGTYTGDTKPDTNTVVDNFYSFSYGTLYLDDIAVNDTAGATDNSWCGDGHVIALTPNANGDSSQLAGSDGNSTDNYLLVDEVPSDGDTTYVESATAGEKDLYNLTACGLTNVNISRVWVESRAKDTTTGSGTIKLLAKTESTEYESANIDIPVIYAVQRGTDYTVNPNTSTAWTVTQVDALQVGLKVVD